LAYADNITIVGENIDIIKKNKEAVLYASKVVGLEVNPEKTKYMLMSRSQKIGQKHSIKIANRSFEDVAKFKYLVATLTDQNYIHEEIKWHMACMGEVRKVYKVLVGKPERKRPLERQKHRWENGIRMDLEKIGWGGVDWIHLVQDRDWWLAFMRAVMNLWVLAVWSYLFT
jgi:hypothetical protein